jgi:hypothetical protein
LNGWLGGVGEDRGQKKSRSHTNKMMIRIIIFTIAGAAPPASHFDETDARQKDQFVFHS